MNQRQTGLVLMFGGAIFAIVTHFTIAETSLSLSLQVVGLIVTMIGAMNFRAGRGHHTRR
ncbi:MAG: hypothetical protein WD294_13765 [Phycisphaeraceae bacterium]